MSYGTNRTSNGSNKTIDAMHFTLSKYNLSFIFADWKQFEAQVKADRFLWKLGLLNAPTIVFSGVYDMIAHRNRETFCYWVGIRKPGGFTIICSPLVRAENKSAWMTEEQLPGLEWVSLPMSLPVVFDPSESADFKFLWPRQRGLLVW